ncbi:hypothetical protein BGZ95_009191 [Linnemannia exigua]|uniref:Uncharacterized protein n=1 Tax=Linnemannia exigua TaxID=604196 RepID=A0AAD4DEZ5_9FUNG|nr:hypothetical protein BGZ95_009191 [Linnemannia exigua]
MKISAIIAFFAIVALVQAAPAPVPASTGKKVHSEAAAASIASYQDKPGPKASSAHKNKAAPGEAAVPMRKRGESAVNAEVKKNKLCVKAPVNADVKNVKVLSGLL